jgi:UDP-N-acetylglucosamine acyltransferase
MIGVHVAHDCVIGNDNVLANNATLAGHVHVGNYCVIGGLSAMHQFVRIGDYAMIGGMSAVENDVIPYGLVMGERARLAGLNLIGLDRRGFEKSDIQILMKVFKQLFLGKNGTFKDRLETVSNDYKNNKTVSYMLEFCQADHNRPLCQPKQ